MKLSYLLFTPIALLGASLVYSWSVLGEDEVLVDEWTTRSVYWGMQIIGAPIVAGGTAVELGVRGAAWCAVTFKDEFGIIIGDIVLLLEEWVFAKIREWMLSIAAALMPWLAPVWVWFSRAVSLLIIASLPYMAAVGFCGGKND